MPLVIVFVAIAAIALAVGIPTTIRNKKNKSKKTSVMGSAMFAMNEIFHPSAHSAIQVVDEQKEARKPNPSPEDK
jgi:ABC-type Co2+ transport system permease subunit